MPTATAVLDYEERLRVLGELAAFPPGEQLLARLVMLEGVALSRALCARVADVDLTRCRLTLADKHSRARVVELDVGSAELAARAVGKRPSHEPLFVSHQGRTLRPERFRRSVLAAARRAGVPGIMTVVRPTALIPA
jgi:site-specific recombinase XerD